MFFKVVQFMVTTIYNLVKSVYLLINVLCS
jgi:hypothetical protein